jgi:hypothetical protein
VDAVAKAEDRDRDKVSVLSALPAAPTLDNLRMAQVHRTTAHPARKVHVVTGLSAVRATQPPLACHVMISNINRLRITEKMISNPAPMRIWEPKVV